jgi:Na+/H+-dicarboxylate symporter
VLFIFKFKTNYEKRSFKVPIQSNETLVGAVINNVSEAMETLTRIREELVPVPGSVNGVNALGLVVFSMCFGFVIGNMKEQGQALRDFFDSLNEAIMRLVVVIMWYVSICYTATKKMLIAINTCSVPRKMPPGLMGSCNDHTLENNAFLGL